MFESSTPRTRSLSDELAGELNALRDKGLHRSRVAMQSPQGVRVVRDGRDVLSFASNDYLGLAADPRVIEAARAGALRWGAGSGASHLLYGHNEVHEVLEASLAQLLGYPRALLFSTGYMANIGVITALCGREDEVFADRLNHASLNDGMQLCRAQFRRYPHGDLDALERMLARSKARRKLLITDAVFSMDGDIAPLPALLGVCERYDAWLLLDDAHGFGVLGEHGAGTLSHYGIRRERIVYMGTLGKAAGVFGAFVAAEDRVIDYLVNRARSYIYTTALPGMLAAALLESLAILRTQDWRRQRLRELAARLGELVPNSCGILVRSQTAIHPYIVGTAQAALRLSEHLLQYGLLVPAVRAPTVPQGSARLRISLSAAHSVEDIDRLADALREYRQ